MWVVKKKINSCKNVLVTFESEIKSYGNTRETGKNLAFSYRRRQKRSMDKAGICY
jgi:hypothetical protein